MTSARGSFGSGVVGYYAAELRRVLRSPVRILSFALASAMHAVGHALLALVAGGIVVAMAQMWGMRGGRSSPLAGDGPVADRAFFLAAVGLGVLVVKGAAGVYATYVQGRLAGEVGAQLRLQLLDALLTLHRLRRPRHGDQGGTPPPAPAVGVAALTDRVREVEAGLEQGLLSGLRAVAQLVPLAVVLCVLSGRMAAVAAVVLGGFGLVLGRARRGYGRATSREAQLRERLLESADESVRHADLWVTYGAEERARARVASLGSALARGAARLRARAAAMSAANEVLGGLALLLAVAASRAGWLGSIADGSTLLAFVVAFFLAYRPLRELAEARLALARAQVAFAELQVAMAPPAEEETARTSIASRIAGTWEPGALELRGLRLARGGTGPLSLRVEAGSIVAIAGPTGAGKTTLLRTLLGLEGAAGGDLLFAGESLVDAPAGPAARPFAWVPQDAPLLADTLGDNVSLGAPVPVDPYDVLHPLGGGRLAEQLAQARLGAGGRPVSGGERQWIALARAIATEQPVLLLDEPTSGLDPDAQRTVLGAIERLRGRRTVLLVTHRPEPLAIADQVLRLDDATGPRASVEAA